MLDKFDISRNASTNVDPMGWLEHHGDSLFGFAISRVHDAAAAEDLVQETFLAALGALSDFSGQSSERTWLIAILKHKIFDYFRRTSRQITFDFDEIELDEFCFDADGHWHEEASPTSWNTTSENLLEEKEFMAVFEKCLAELPRNLAIVFTLREIDGLDTGEICNILNISPGNFAVIMHRARLRLRQALEQKWFAKNARHPAVYKTTSPLNCGLPSEI